MNNFLQRSATALAVCLAASPIHVSGKGVVGVEVQVVSQSAHGPEIMAFVRNTGSELEDLLLVVSSGDDPLCMTPVSKDPPWPDPFLLSNTRVQLEPGAWITLIRPTQLLSRVPDRCVASLEVYNRAGKNLRDTLKAEAKKKLAVPQRRQVRVSAKGSYVTSSAVIAIDFGSSLRTSADEAIMQVQLQVNNLSSDWRDIAVVNRSVNCSDPARAEWIIGPGELPQGLQAGPAPVLPKRWTVLTQRLRVHGEMSKCRVSFELAEWLYDENGVRPKWVKFHLAATSLKAVGHVVYLTPH